jgi:hypothetical protein
MLVSRREYKLMLDHRMFVDRKAAAVSFCRELHTCARPLKRIECDGEFEKTKRRQLAFLDTRDRAIALNRFVFRRRAELEGDRRVEYTLKCRSPDRYVAAGADVQAAKRLKAAEKLEEDIAAPFVVRFSHSNTVEGPGKSPETLADAARLFPALAKLERDGAPCPGELELHPVSALEAYERVLTGPTVTFNKTTAEIALILWSDGAQGRPLVAEFSFRYADRREGYSPKAARLAFEFFERVQRLDWCLPEGRTKTQYVYRDA